ncbi:MAG: hypothetical protein CVU39_01300 [Chloroflexi bacterium HGW-Chloroflexi-10]|nr:MAG: hypothetical protein CVU39_01300 [Chloroflexi bacterium HGW-Chloroflexi-10]
MNKKNSHIVSSYPSDPSGHDKRSVWQRLVEPAATITEVCERRQASLVSALLFVLVLTMLTGVVYMGFFSSSPTVGIVLAGADIAIGFTYFLSRTRYYRFAPLLSLIVLALIPIMNVGLETDHSPENLLLLLIWNSLTILLSSAITSFRNTVVFVVVNILTFLLLPVFIPTVSFINMTFPLIFNGVNSLTILVFTQHRNRMEKDRLLEMSRVNQQLQVELSERKKVEEQLAHTALHDPLTDLPNRVLFTDRLRHVMERAKRKKNLLFAVFFLDLDRFKVVNDSMGHNIGDLLLIESAHRLKSCLRNQDTVARFGGDEFVILLEDMEYPTDYKIVADRILQSLRLPADLGGYKVFISVSIGIVLNDARYERGEDILRDADIAMYRAKNQGRNCYEIFDPSMLAGVMTHLELETDLRRALENQEFIVHYQPILNMEARRINGFEALVRWQHPTHGLTAPAEFIPTLEEMGLIVPMGYWVLDEACRQIRAWQVQYPSDPPLTVSVNLSTRQCAQADLVQRIAEILQKNKLDAGSLKLELTESLIVENAVSTSNMLSNLREMGIQVQIDDFGTGYSSLAYLNSLPIDTLKIDRTFISQLGATGSGLEIVRTILALAHGLEMNVIAEGVETDDQLSILLAMGCENVQGFLFAKPVSHQEAGVLLGKSFAALKD